MDDLKSYRDGIRQYLDHFTKTYSYIFEPVELYSDQLKQYLHLLKGAIWRKGQGYDEKLGIGIVLEKLMLLIESLRTLDLFLKSPKDSNPEDPDKFWIDMENCDETVTYELQQFYILYRLLKQLMSNFPRQDIVKTQGLIDERLTNIR